MLWKILLVCLILGGAQWMHAHPDSQASLQAMNYVNLVRVEWDKFVDHFSEYAGKFPAYMRSLLDTTPTPATAPTPLPKKT